LEEKNTLLIGKNDTVSLQWICAEKTAGFPEEFIESIAY